MKDDKLIHFTVSAIIALIVSIDFNNPIYGFAISMIIGFIKEFYDMWKLYKYNRGIGFDFFDILADLTGSVWGSFLYLLWELLNKFN